MSAGVSFNACLVGFSRIGSGSTATGCRYGELVRMTVADFNREAGTVTIRISKAGKARHVALADEGRALFQSVTAGRAAKT